MNVEWFADDQLDGEKQRTTSLVGPPFVWRNLNTTVSCRLTGSIIFAIHLEHMHWVDVYVDTTGFQDTERVGSSLILLTCGRVQKYFDPAYQGLRTLITVDCIELVVPHYPLLRERFLEAERHKIVAQCNGVFLGRPQSIVTSAHTSHGTRVYSWYARPPGNKDGFPGVRCWEEAEREQHARDALDLDQIRRHLPISARNTQDYTPDADTFKNEHRVLPVPIGGDGVTLQFYNLKFNPVRFAETTIRHATLQQEDTRVPSTPPQTRRASIARLFKTRVPPKTKECKTLCGIHVAPHILVDVQYTEGEVLHIRLIVKDYLTTLDVMGDNIPPNSV